MRKSLCSRTMARHVPLVGVDKNKVFMTKLAEPYPDLFAKKLGQAFVKAYKTKIGNSITAALK